jgi:hypothetical protein
LKRKALNPDLLACGKWNVAKTLPPKASADHRNGVSSLCTVIIRAKQPACRGLDAGDIEPFAGHELNRGARRIRIGTEPHTACASHGSRLSVRSNRGGEFLYKWPRVTLRHVCFGVELKEE